MEHNFEEYLQILKEFCILLLYTFYCYVQAAFRFFVPPPLKSLDDDIILITGAANGIGKEICLQFASTGATLVCWDVDKRGNDNLLTLLKQLGVKAFAYEVDVSNRTEVERFAAKVTEEVGPVTMLVNNAGIMPCLEFLSHNPQQLERVFQVNMFSHFWTLRAFLPQMMERGRGHIVTVCSAAGLLPTRHLAPYCGTKHAVHGFTEALKNELTHLPNKPNIQFTTLYPFSCNTGLVNGVKCHSRFPFFLPITEPQFVARKLVDGVRRNYEHVYVPAAVQFFGTTAKGILPNVQTAAADFLQCYVEPEK